MPRKNLNKPRILFSPERKRALKESDQGSYFNQKLEERSETEMTETEMTEPEIDVNNDELDCMDDEQGESFDDDLFGTCFDPLCSDSELTEEEEDDEDCQSDDPDDRTGYRLWDMDILSNVITSLACKKCGGDVTLTENPEGRAGWCSEMVVKCLGCGDSTKTKTSKPVGRAFDVNKRAVLAFRIIGKGQAAALKFSGVMDIPKPVNVRSWKEHMVNIMDATDEVCRLSMAKAALELRENSDSLESIEAPVSFDGSWANRGLTSKHGFVAAMSVDTNKVLDCHYMTTQCHQCSVWESQPKNQAYLDFMVAHFDECPVNHEGSAQSMESSGIEIMFKRSEDQAVLYNPYVGDGDSASFKRICTEKPYGDLFVHKKQECVGHVQKRMGSRLRTVVNRHKGLKLSDGLGMQGKGRLTIARIDAFQTFFGRAIRSNKGDSEAMSRETWAILRHYQAEPNHDYCPVGPTSWCKFNVDKANGSSTYRPPKNGLPDTVVQEITPVFNDLTKPELLKACEQCLTQNSNESLNHVVWAIAPKEQFQPATAVQTAVNLGVLWFNDGLVPSMKQVMTRLGLHFGDHSLECLSTLDAKRAATRAYKSTEKVKTLRKVVRYKKCKSIDAFEKSEGVQYKSGAFHTKATRSAPMCRKCNQPRKGHNKSTCN